VLDYSENVGTDKVASYEPIVGRAKQRAEDAMDAILVPLLGSIVPRTSA
jgi:hypothetical protein